MPISKRTLTKWRKNALKEVFASECLGDLRDRTDDEEELLELNNRILLLIAELLDQQLLKEK